MATTPLSFGEESFDHILTDELLRIVRSKKPYDLQDVVEAVWYNRLIPQNRTVRPFMMSGQIDYKLVEVLFNGQWKSRNVDEVIHRMIERTCEIIKTRLEAESGCVVEDLDWLMTLPSKPRALEYAFLYKGILRFVFKAHPGSWAPAPTPRIMQT